MCLKYPMEKVRFAVRTGKGTCSMGEGGEFTDIIHFAERIAMQHSGWQSVRCGNKRYRLGGGIRTCYFICLNNPVGRN